MENSSKLIGERIDDLRASEPRQKTWVPLITYVEWKLVKCVRSNKFYSDFPQFPIGNKAAHALMPLEEVLMTLKFTEFYISWYLELIINKVLIESELYIIMRSPLR